MTEDEVADAVRSALASAGPYSEMKMFGGIGFMVGGNMVAGVSKRGLLLRLGKDGAAQALGRPELRPMEMRGRPMEGYAYADPAMMDAAGARAWVRAALRYVVTLPPKTAKAKASGRKGKAP